MKVRLTKKLAERGDVIDLNPHEAALIVAEEWAVPERRHEQRPTQQRRRGED